MFKILYLFLLGVLPFQLTAQFLREGDTAYARIVTEECGDRTFTKTEVLPGFKISREAFQDSIVAYLQLKHALPANKKMTIMFVLTGTLKLMNFQLLQGRAPRADMLFRAFDHFSQLWIPAIQNGHRVCSIVKCDLDFAGDKLNVQIKQ